jgi:hypothetical protein
MTIKLLLLKSGEDIIADVAEMAFGEDDQKRVVGYFLKQPCVVKMRNPTPVSEKAVGVQKSGFEVSLFPWMPLSKDSTIPVASDWVITMVDPIVKLKEMYVQDIVNYGKDEDDQSDSADEQASSD